MTAAREPAAPDVYVARALADWPPLTEDQRAHLADLVTNPRPANGGAE